MASTKTAIERCFATAPCPDTPAVWIELVKNRRCASRCWPCPTTRDAEAQEPRLPPGGRFPSLRLDQTMMVRAYHVNDLAGVLDVFNRAVHEVAVRDYAPEQLAAWAPSSPDLTQWAQRLPNEA